MTTTTGARTAAGLLRDGDDGTAFGRTHAVALALGMAMMMIDGYEVGLLGLVLPMLARSYDVPPTALTWVLSAQQVGMVLGAYLIAPLADRFGRRPLILGALALVSLSSFLTLRADGIAQLAACRIVTGVFASTLIANIVAWTSEIAPAKSRTMMITCVLTGSLAGGVLGSIVQAVVLERHGWQGAFWLGGALPLVLILPSWWWLVESPRFGKATSRAIRKAGADAAPTIPRGDEEADLGAVRGLFGAGRGTATILLWLAFLFDFLFISAWFWKTTVFHDRLAMDGHAIATTTAIEVVLGMAGILGVGLVIKRLGMRVAVPACYVGAALAIVTLTVTAPDELMFVLLGFLALCQNAGHTGIALVASDLYPPRCRATGVGWAYGAGRLASVFGPPFGALAIKHSEGATAFFLMLSLPLLIAGGTMIVLFTVSGSQRRSR